jgi:hypothetical protein
MCLSNREFALEPLSALKKATTTSTSHCFLRTVVAAVLAGVSLPLAVSSSSKRDKETGKKNRHCGEWCAAVPGKTPCLMDALTVPCKGKHCQTTAGLWSLFALGPKTKPRPVSCKLHKAGLAHPVGAGLCVLPACLTPKINPLRHPAPTGLGVFC